MISKNKYDVSDSHIWSIETEIFSEYEPIVICRTNYLYSWNRPTIKEVKDFLKERRFLTKNKVLDRLEIKSCKIYHMI